MSSGVSALKMRKKFVKINILCQTDVRLSDGYQQKFHDINQLQIDSVHLTEILSNQIITNSTEFLSKDYVKEKLRKNQTTT